MNNNEFLHMDDEYNLLEIINESKKITEELSLDDNDYKDWDISKLINKAEMLFNELTPIENIYEWKPLGFEKKFIVDSNGFIKYLGFDNI